MTFWLSNRNELTSMESATNEWGFVEDCFPGGDECECKFLAGVFLLVFFFFLLLPTYSLRAAFASTSKGGLEIKYLGLLAEMTGPVHVHMGSCVDANDFFHVHLHGCCRPRCCCCPSLVCHFLSRCVFAWIVAVGVAFAFDEDWGDHCDCNCGPFRCRDFQRVMLPGLALHFQRILASPGN